MNSPFENQPIQQDSPFKASGRFGRLSYAAWTLLFSLVIVVAVLIVAFTFGLTTSEDLSGLSTAGMIILGIVYIACIYVSFIFTIRRLHDRNNTGWLSLLMLIPAVNFIFMIYLFAAKGTEGTNDYGPQRPTLGWERVLIWIYIVIIPLVFVFGVIAGIMVPSYQSYIEKSESIEIGTPSQSQ